MWMIFSENEDFNDTRKPFDDFKNKQQKCMKLCFLICKSMYILKVYSIHYTLRLNTDVEKISFGQNKRCKKCPLFPFVSSNSSQFYFNLRFLDELSWSTRFVSLKLCVGISIFDSVSFLLKFIFLFSKMHGLFEFKTS